MIGDNTKNPEQLFARLRSACESIDSALSEMKDWVRQNVAGDDAHSRHWPPGLEKTFNVLHAALIRAKNSVSEIDEDVTMVVFKIARASLLTREQFYLASAFGLLNYSNKNCGVSDFDDYEIFKNFYYEDEERRAYIDPKMRPPEPPVAMPGGGHILKAQAGFASLRPPEELRWDRLRPEQREFFKRYAPEVAARFKREIT